MHGQHLFFPSSALWVWTTSPYLSVSQSVFAPPSCPVCAALFCSEDHREHTRSQDLAIVLPQMSIRINIHINSKDYKTISIQLHVPLTNIVETYKLQGTVANVLGHGCKKKKKHPQVDQTYEMDSGKRAKEIIQTI